ncbi:hypothetical protein [Burkholderia sp. Bp9031]|uniref:hypothetical protein n=1 Tax=Burkholderia sp. Bp9031 TaxID=2184566 RepID=UPI000F5EFD2B|nr:hypothetical protein [Burkholderia sp. Bp9031]
MSPPAVELSGGDLRAPTTGERPVLASRRRAAAKNEPVSRSTLFDIGPVRAQEIFLPCLYRNGLSARDAERRLQHVESCLRTLNPVWHLNAVRQVFTRTNGNDP